MIRGIVTVGGWTIASRLFGFLRDMLIAALAGTGPVADAFFVANKLPNLFRRLFGEGAFNAAFVPEFSGLLAAEGRPAARRFAEEALSVMAFWLGTITILGEVFMPQLMAVLAPGFALIPEKFALAVTLTRITFPYLILICLAALLSGVLNGLDRFAAAAAAPLVYNGVSIAAMLLLTPYVPTVGHALAWGVSASGVVQLALLMWAVRRTGMRLHIPRPRLTPQTRLLLRRMTPGLVGAGATQLNQAVDVIIASLLPPGTVSLLYYAERVYQLPLGTIGVAVGTALLPLLSRQVRAGRAQDSIATLNRAIEFALFLTLPAALALMVAAFPVMYVLFGRGAFDAESARLSAQSLTAYALGLPAYVLLKVLAPAFFARGDTATPVKIGLITLALNFALNVAFMIPLRHVGPPLATSLAAIFNASCLALILTRRGHLVSDSQLRRRLPRMMMASVAMSVTLWLLQSELFNGTDYVRGSRWAALFILVTIGVGVYGLAGQALGAFDLREARRVLARRTEAVSSSR
ncbi:MAG: murein biosynthesis integral membrane protein MurJ [Acetobacteraceae bacterium]|nr:murein biosynthesis integral membrane protein MurJ [Acetobacteraceae bacterium]